MPLQIEEDERFHELEWRIQRIGWAVIGLVVGAALVGLLGPGPLSTAYGVSEEGGVEVEYRRFLRAGADATVRVEIAAGMLAGSQTTVSNPRVYASQLQIDSVAPEPEAVAIDGG